MDKRYMTKRKTESILKLFYRTELREGEEVVDNRSIAIAEELGIPRQTVDYIISKLINPKIEDIFCTYETIEPLNYFSP